MLEFSSLSLTVDHLATLSRLGQNPLHVGYLSTQRRLFGEGFVHEWSQVQLDELDETHTANPSFSDTWFAIYCGCSEAYRTWLWVNEREHSTMLVFTANRVQSGRIWNTSKRNFHSIRLFPLIIWLKTGSARKLCLATNVDSLDPHSFIVRKG